MEIDRGGEYQGAAIGRPLGLEFIARAARHTCVSRLSDKCGTGQKITGHGTGPGVLHEQVDLQVVAPMVPLTHRENVIGRRMVLPLCPLLFLFLIGCVVSGTRVDLALEGESLPVGAPGRCPGPGDKRRKAHGLAGSCHVENIDLRGFLFLSFLRFTARGAESKSAAIRAPGRTFFGIRGGREASRRDAAVDGNEPEIANRAALFVRGFFHRNHRPTSVRARHRCANSAHHPHVLVGDSMPFSHCMLCTDGGRWQHEQREKDSDGQGCTHGFSPREGY